MKRLLALALCLAALSGCGARLDKTSEFLRYKDKDTISAAQTAIQAYYDENNLAGISVGILVDGYVEFFNLGNTKEGGTPITEDTRFDLGTLTQVFTGVAYSESIYKRYLSDGTSVKKLFPYLDIPLWGGTESMTCGQLATHRSGMPQKPTNLPRGDVPYEFYSELDLRRYLSTASLDSQPGTVYQPGGMDMGLLSFAIEVARKTPFEQHVKSVIMYNISMTRTTITLDEDDTSPWAMPHDADGNPLPHQEYSSLLGMSAFKSTAYDMMLFAWCNMDMPGTESTFDKEAASQWTLQQKLYMVLDTEAKSAEYSKLLGSQSVTERLYAAMMIAQDEHYSDGDTVLGYGYRLGEIGGNKYVWQNGGDAGNGGYIGFVPGTSTAVVVLSNTGADVEPLGLQLISLLNGVT